MCWWENVVSHKATDTVQRSMFWLIFSKTNRPYQHISLSWLWGHRDTDSKVAGNWIKCCILIEGYCVPLEVRNYETCRSAVFNIFFLIRTTRTWQPKPQVAQISFFLKTWFLTNLGPIVLHKRTPWFLTSSNHPLNKTLGTSLLPAMMEKECLLGNCPLTD